MVVGLTVGKAFPLVVAVSHERLLALQIKFVHHLLLKIAFIQTKMFTLAQTKCSTHQCFPSAVTTLPSIGRLEIVVHN